MVTQRIFVRQEFETGALEQMLSIVDRYYAFAPHAFMMQPGSQRFVGHGIARPPQQQTARGIHLRGRVSGDLPSEQKSQKMCCRLVHHAGIASGP